MKISVNIFRVAALIATSLATVSTAFAQYSVVTVTDGGTISGTVKWTGTKPQPVTLPITKNPDICAPQGQKTRDQEERSHRSRFLSTWLPWIF